MIKRFYTILTLIILLSVAYTANAQVENVPVSNPVYGFLKRMELKGYITRYHDAVLPLSRKQVAEYLLQIKERNSKEIEQSHYEHSLIEYQQLKDYYTEFQYDMSHSMDSTYSLFDSSGLNYSGSSVLGESQKYLYSYSDSNVSMFVDGLLTLDARRSDGDALGGEHAEFVQFGGRIRGTVYDKLGYYLQVTNAQFWGSRNVLQRDKYIGQAYTLGILDAQNFDFAEGYVRYDGGIFSAEVGRERMLWGTGYNDKLVISDNIRVFDFIRVDAEYKALKYTFLHGWLLGKKSNRIFYGNDGLPSDSSFFVDEPVVADKYIGAHRLEISLPSVTLGFQEMAIYSNRSVDMAYLNPLTLIESAQRSREERDNILWAFDAKAHVIDNIEFQASLVMDDLNFPKIGTSSYQNKFAFQLGMMMVDPMRIENSLFAIEYTRINPYTFSHERSRDNDYGSLNTILSHHMGPNSEGWFMRFDYQPLHRLSTSLRWEIQHSGENVYDANGILIKNVGGDYLVPHRSIDPQQATLLDGNRVDILIVQAYVTYEFLHQFFLDFKYQFTQREDIAGAFKTANRDYGLALRMDF